MSTETLLCEQICLLAKSMFDRGLTGGSTGNISARGPQARATFVANLEYACAQAGPHGIMILIEPLNRYDAPGYFLTTTAQAIDLIETMQTTNLKHMFDRYHV